MIKTVALGLSYLTLLFGFAAGIEALSGKQCSDWLTECAVDQFALARHEDDQVLQPEAPELP